MRAWRVHAYGRPSESLRLDDIAVPAIGPGELRVRTLATVLNFNEVDGCRGRYLTVSPPIPYTLGMEVVGEVDSAAVGLESWVGQRVVATAVGAFGAHAEQVTVSADMTFQAPPALDNIHAAAFFFPFHLAHLGLFERGRLQPGESVLIHAAAGGVGSAAVQLAATAGARVIATCGGPEKAGLCTELGADAVIDYRRNDFVDSVGELTGGRGVDLVFDGVGLANQSLRCLGYGGRYRTIGFSGGIDAEERPFVTPRTLCFGNFSAGGVLLAYASDPLTARRATGFNITPRSVGEEIHDRLTRLLDEGRIRPIVGSVVSVEELPAALDAMEDRRTIGRTVVRW